MSDNSTLTALLVAFAPGVIATARGHRSLLGIWVLNIVALGLVLSLVLAWFGLLVDLVALVWALGSNTNANIRRDAQSVGRAVREALAAEQNEVDRAQWIKETGDRRKLR